MVPTLVVEETYPVLELQIQDRRNVMGRLSGHVPQQGELTPEVVEEIILKAVGEQPTAVQPPKIKPRRPSLCPGCPHRPAFFMMRQVFDQAIYSGDIGCYTLGINMGAVDTCLCMGASIGMAGGSGPHSTRERRDQSCGHHRRFHFLPCRRSGPHQRGSYRGPICPHDHGQQHHCHDRRPTDSCARFLGRRLSRSARSAWNGSLEDAEWIFWKSWIPMTTRACKKPCKRPRTTPFNENKGVAVVITRRPCVRAPNVELSSAQIPGRR